MDALFSWTCKLNYQRLLFYESKFKPEITNRVVVLTFCFLSKTHGTFKLNYYKIKKFNTYFEQFFEHYLDHLILLRIVAKFEDTFRCKGLFGTLLLKNCTICNNGSQENLEIEFNY